jgi:hypothetical protein
MTLTSCEREMTIGWGQLVRMSSGLGLSMAINRVSDFVVTVVGFVK